MGGKNSGRRPRPAALQGLFGRTDRINKDAPVVAPAPSTFDDPPAELDGDLVAIAYWRESVPQLREVGIVTRLERGVLIALCRLWARYVAAEADIQETGLVVPGENGVVTNPSVGVAERVFPQLLKVWAELGMTPAARTKVAAAKKAEAPAPSKWAGVL